MARFTANQRTGIRITRDLVLFCVGLAIIVEQTVVANAMTERPVLLGLAAAMVGLPVYFNLVERRPAEEDPPPARSRKASS